MLETHGNVISFAFKVIVFICLFRCIFLEKVNINPFCYKNQNKNQKMVAPKEKKRRDEHNIYISLVQHI